MRLFRKLKILVLVFALAAVMAGALSVTSAFAIPKDCPWVCGPVPFPPGYSCWHQC